MKKPTRKEERKLLTQGFRLIAGVDEAGRGAWAGPLVAAAVILPAKHKIKGINDSKKLKPEQRDKLYVQITRSALSWAVHLVHHDEIDKNGIAKANHLALQQAVKKLKPSPDYVLIDALEVELGNTPSQSIIKGDEKIVSIAAASIIAKVTRDQLMHGWHILYPAYSFHIHKGYGTERHAKALKKHGPSPIHRQSFLPIKRLIRAKSRKHAKNLN